MAWRNLWRQRRRTILTLISIAFGGFLAVLMTAMQDRSFADFVDNAAKLGAGHVTIQHPEYRRSAHPLPDRHPEHGIRSAPPPRRTRSVIRVVERASGQAMLSTASDSFGGVLYRLRPQPSRDEETMEFTEGLVQGKMLFEKR